MRNEEADKNLLGGVTLGYFISNDEPEENRQHANERNQRKARSERHSRIPALKRYPMPHTVSIWTADPSFLRSRETWTSKVRSVPSRSEFSACSNNDRRVMAKPG